MFNYITRTVYYNETRLLKTVNLNYYVLTADGQNRYLYSDQMKTINNKLRNESEHKTLDHCGDALMYLPIIDVIILLKTLFSFFD